MKRSFILTSTIVLFLVFNFFTGCTQKTNYDIIIKSGTIIDGTGHAEILADIGITDDRIVEIGTRLRGIKSAFKTNTFQSLSIIDLLSYIKEAGCFQPATLILLADTHIQCQILSCLCGK